MELIIEFLASATGIAEEMISKALSLLGFIGTIIITPAGIIYALWHYKIRRFTDQITFSGNYFEKDGDGNTVLRIRNPLMLPIGDLLPANPLFMLALRRTIRSCTPEDPFMRMSADDMDILQPSLINAYSSLGADGINARMAGEAVAKKELLMAVTFEKDGRVRNQKIRVMLIAESELLRVCDAEFAASVQFERAHHAYRMYTLRKMAETYEKEKSLSNDEYRIVRPIELFSA